MAQPDEAMPAMRAFDLQVSVDILTHLQTLPKGIAGALPFV